MCITTQKHITCKTKGTAKALRNPSATYLLLGLCGGAVDIRNLPTWPGYDTISQPSAFLGGHYSPVNNAPPPPPPHQKCHSKQISYSFLNNLMGGQYSLVNNIQGDNLGGGTIFTITPLLLSRLMGMLAPSLHIESTDSI